MRLSKVSIVKVGDIANYAVQIRIISGENDLLVDKNDNAYSTSPLATYDPATVRCAIGAGSQFCSVAELYTIANKRI
jgi:hypothetical protein